MSWNNRPWQTPEMLSLRAQAGSNPVIQAFLAYLDDKVEAGTRPVPPTQNNWQVHRAWLDGQVAILLEIQGFFDPEVIRDEALRVAEDTQKQAKVRKPLGDDPFLLA